MPFPPPPPPPPSFTPPAAPDGRGILLQSIRQGTTLKKTITNDKSAPSIAGRVQGSGESEAVSAGGGGGDRWGGGGAPLNGSATLGRANGLGGLFANGMPKLKPTGLDIGQSQNSQSLTSLPSATASGNHEQTRRQFNVDIKNRGPPPKPPPATQKPSMPQVTATVSRSSFCSTNIPKAPLTNVRQTFLITSADAQSVNVDTQSNKHNPSLFKTNNTTTTNDLKSQAYFQSTKFNTIGFSNNISFNRAHSTMKMPASFPQLSPTFNFPNAKSPPQQFKLNHPSVNISSVSSKQNFKTLPIRIHHEALASSRPSLPLLRLPILSSSMNSTTGFTLSPPNSPRRDDYNRFKSASTIHSTSPSTLSKPIEFKIQRPHLSTRFETSTRSTSDSVLTGSGTLHNRSSSTTSLAQGPRSHKAPVGGHGKPHLAPKPPGIKPPGRPTRTQSMRAPRSLPVTPPTGQSPLLPNPSELNRGAFYQSQDSLLHTPPPPKHHTLPSLRGAPARPPLRPPQTRPPPPPPNKLAMTPPPPPNAPPPPPPHRVLLTMSASPAPPAPPARNSSMRNGMPSSFSSKLEARFIERFHLSEEFPPPQPFLGVTKVYNSRTAKQPAPQPPQKLQLMWSRDQQDNSSSC